MIARLQKIMVLVLLGAATAWLWAFWHASKAIAVAGFLLLVSGYAIFLALEFLALRSAQDGSAGMQASWPEILRAWLGEILVAPQVFGWRQPFRSNEIDDLLEPNGLRGAVFIHGFVCNRGFWTPWLARLRAERRSFIAVNLEPAFGSIDAYAPLIDAAVSRVAATTGLAPVLVCHSMGGLAARAWLRAYSADQRVHHVITIGSPHHGTWLGQFSHLANGRQMRLDSEWLLALQRDEPATRCRLFTCWYSNCDNIVFPVATATLPGADNRFLSGVAHVQLGFDQRVMAESLAKIAAV